VGPLAPLTLVDMVAAGWVSDDVELGSTGVCRNTVGELQIDNRWGKQANRWGGGRVGGRQRLGEVVIKTTDTANKYISRWSGAGRVESGERRVRVHKKESIRTERGGYSSRFEKSETTRASERQRRGRRRRSSSSGSRD